MRQKSFVLIGYMMFFLLTNSYGQNNIVSNDTTVTNEFLQASIKFLDGDFKECIPHYVNVLKKDTLLTKEYWYVLIDNLGMAYGITGNLKSAELTFKYGLSKDQTYPLFYYNLACVYAEKNDMNICIDYLISAFRYRENMRGGEVFPDPLTDDSFQKFMKNNKFTSTIEKLKRQ